MIKGFTLIEIIIVVALLASVSLVGTNTIIEFQRNAILSAAAQELASTLRTAQANSSAGQIQSGETASTFTIDGLPYFGLNVNGNSYQLIRKYTPAGAGSETTETLETHEIDSSVVPAPSPMTVMFARTSGIPNTAVTFTLTRIHSTVSRTVTLHSNGLISL